MEIYIHNWTLWNQTYRQKINKIKLTHVGMEIPAPLSFRSPRSTRESSSLSSWMNEKGRYKWERGQQGFQVFMGRIDRNCEDTSPAAVQNYSSLFQRRTPLAVITFVQDISGLPNNSHVISNFHFYECRI